MYILIFYKDGKEVERYPNQKQYPSKLDIINKLKTHDYIFDDYKVIKQEK